MSLQLSGQGKCYDREALEIWFKGKNMAGVLDMTVEQVLAFFAQLTTGGHGISVVLSTYWNWTCCA